QYPGKDTGSRWRRPAPSRAERAVPVAPGRPLPRGPRQFLAARAVGCGVTTSVSCACPSVADRAELAGERLQAIGVVEDGLADRLMDRLFQLGAMRRGKLLENSFGAEHGGLVQQTFVTHGWRR